MNIETSQIVDRLTLAWGYPREDSERIAQELRTCTSEVQAAFEKWWRDGGLDEHLEIEGYTLQRLTDEYDFLPIAAFLTMNWLACEPEAALRALDDGYDIVE